MSSVGTAILAGVVIGVLGRLILPGHQAIGWIATFVLGLVGAFAGAYAAEGLDIDTWWKVLIVQAAVAAVLVLLVTGLIRRSSMRRSRAAD